MGIEALAKPVHPPSIMELIRRGVDLGGYIIRNERGDFVDQGWFYQPLLELGQQYGITGRVCKHLSIDEISFSIISGSLMVVSVSSEIGERKASITHRGGHLVLVYGFEWGERRCKR